MNCQLASRNWLAPNTGCGRAIRFTHRFNSNRYCAKSGRFELVLIIAPWRDAKENWSSGFGSGLMKNTIVSLLNSAERGLKSRSGTEDEFVGAQAISV